MKYKLINKQTNEEHVCSKVTIDGFDYYVSDNHINKLKPDDAYHTIVENPRRVVRYTKHIQDTTSGVIICTNNPNINILKVVDEVEELAEKAWGNSLATKGHRIGFKYGYSKSQETHPFSLNDVKEIINLAREQYWDVDNRGFSSNAEGDWSFKYSTEDEIIQKYQETKVLKIFYE
jgi:hypothetical protein